MSKRTDYISWDEYFMGVALLAAKRSKDPNTQVGACIVNPENVLSPPVIMDSLRASAMTTFLGEGWRIPRHKISLRLSRRT